MKTGVFGDIRGNIALGARSDAVMASKPDKLHHFGDPGGSAPFVSEVVARCRVASKGSRALRRR
ncbi:MAG TPA: hypothetical protein VF903_11065 [Nitrospirota bacterium]